MQQAEKALKSLLIQGLDGDQAAYRKFLSETSMFLRRYVQRQLSRMGRPGHDDEDIVQEVLLAIDAKGHTYDREVPVTAWIHAIARYKLIDFLRRTESAGQSLSLCDIEEIAGGEMAACDITLSVRKVVSALPDRLRVPIKLMKLYGFSVAETATRTGLSEAAVKVNIHRGLKAMSRMLGSPTE